MRSTNGYARAAKTAFCSLLASLPGWQLCRAADECLPSGGVAVAATPTSATRASLFWQVTPGNVPSGPIAYMLFRGTSPSNLTQIAKTTAPFYSDVSLTPATTYLYVVQAVSNGTVVSGAACPTTPPLPNPPSGVTATPISPTEVTLSWAEKIDPNSLAIADFHVFAGTSPNNLAQVATVKDVSITLHASAGTTYYYLIEAEDVDGDLSAAPVTVQVTMPNH